MLLGWGLWGNRLSVRQAGLLELIPMAVILFALQVFLPALLSAWNVLLKPPPRLGYEALCFPDLSQVIHMHVKVWEALYRFQD